MSLRKFSFWLIMLTIVLGGIVPFAAQFLFPTLFQCYSPAGAEVWNQYVSIILGIVATTLSVISLVLCFRSEDRSVKSNIELQETFNRLNDKVDEIGKNQAALEESFKHYVPQSGTGDYIVKHDAISPEPAQTRNNDESKDI